MRNRLARHIERTLVHHPCVVLPGLGGFVLENTPARYCHQSLLAYPPSVELHFNEALNHHDGLLETAYAQCYGLSVRRARLMLQEDVRVLRTELVRAERCQLEGVGTLTLGPQGRINFSAQPSTLLSSPSYGLSTVLLPESAPISLESGTGSASSIASIVDQEKEDGYIHLRISRRAVSYTITACVLFALLYILPLDKIPRIFTDTGHKHYSASVIPAERAVMAIVEHQEQKQDALPKASEVRHEPVEGVAGRYYIIVATERQPERAMSYREMIQDKNFPELCVLRGKSVYRVSVASFATSREAYSYVQQLDKVLQAWVYLQK